MNPSLMVVVACSSLALTALVGQRQVTSRHCRHHLHAHLHHAVSHHGVTSMSEQKKTPPKKSPKLGVTPGGPVKEENIHLVEPGQKIHMKPDGTYELVPEPPKKKLGARG